MYNEKLHKHLKPRPLVSATYPDYSRTQEPLWEYGNRACVEVAILNTVFTVRSWARSCYFIRI